MMKGINHRLTVALCFATLPALLHADIWTDTGESKFSYSESAKATPLQVKPAEIPLRIPHPTIKTDDDFFLVPEIQAGPQGVLHESRVNPLELERLKKEQKKAREKEERQRRNEEKAGENGMRKEQQRQKNNVSETVPKAEPEAVTKPGISEEKLATLPEDLQREVRRFSPDWSKGLIFINKRDLTFYLYNEQGDQVLNCGCAVGINKGHKQKQGDYRTPEGMFTVQQIQPSETWGHDFGDGKGYIRHAYGNWFIRLKTGFSGIGIHGTHAPESIGTRATEGCIRLKNEELDKLKPLVKIGMTVIISEDE